MEELITKSGIERDPEDKFTISTTAVQKYLMESILGVTKGVGCDFRRFTGISPDHSYVSMRVILEPSILVKKENPKYAGEKILAEYSSDSYIRSDVIESLKPFMYPDINMNDTANLQRLFAIGLGGEHIAEIQRYGKLTYIQDANVYGVLLRPERIIDDMLSDPTSTEKRSWGVQKVEGTTSDTITWTCIVDRGGFKKAMPTGLNFDTFFKK